MEKPDFSVEENKFAIECARIVIAQLTEATADGSIVVVRKQREFREKILGTIQGAMIAARSIERKRRAMAKARKQTKDKADSQGGEDVFGHVGTHDCKATGCSIQVPRAKAFCPKHWEKLPAELKRALVTAYTDWTRGDDPLPRNTPRGAPRQLPSVEKLREAQRQCTAWIEEVEARDRK